MNARAEAREQIPRRPPALVLAGGLASVLDHVVATTGPEREACGLLGGRIHGPQLKEASRLVLLTNLATRSRSFAFSVDELIHTTEGLVHVGLQPVALFHTHVSGCPRPSRRDLRLPFSTGLASLIAARRDGRLLLHCGDLIGGRYAETAITCV